MQMQTSDKKIPFVKPVRVGNYKLWRCKYGKSDIEQVCVSNLGGDWSVRIPETSGMYATISIAYGMDGGGQFLETVFANMQNVCLVNNEFLHDGFSILCNMMMTPYVFLPEKEMRKRMKRQFELFGTDKKAAEKHIDEMCGYRNELYDIINAKIADIIGDYELKMVQRKEDEKGAQQSLDNEAVARQMVDEVERVENEQQAE